MGASHNMCEMTCLTEGFFSSFIYVIYTCRRCTGTQHHLCNLGPSALSALSTSETLAQASGFLFGFGWGSDHPWSHLSNDAQQCKHSTEWSPSKQISDNDHIQSKACWSYAGWKLQLPAKVDLQLPVGGGGEETQLCPWWGLWLISNSVEHEGHQLLVSLSGVDGNFCAPIVPGHRANDRALLQWPMGKFLCI